jgi:hypothetical protein
MKFELPGLIFERKKSNIKFHETLPVKAGFFHVARWMDGYEEANSRFSQFC